MKKIKLTSEEQEISDAMDRGEYVPVTGKELKELADSLAARKKDASLTIRVNSRDINRIKKMADKKGIPYQTYISEVIHRVAESL
jgi:predicted DNA binding CopG/RHH family protein